MEYSPSDNSKGILNILVFILYNTDFSPDH